MAAKDIARYRKAVNDKLRDFTNARRSVKEHTMELEAQQLNLAHSQEAQRVVQEVAESVQQTVHTQISAIVTRCLKAVYGEEAYTFELKFRQARGKTEAIPLFVRDGHHLDPFSAAGGGVIEVAAFALRLACLLLSRPRLERVLILDEPFSKCDKKAMSRVGNMLASLSEELKIQIVLVTHSPTLEVGKVIQLGEPNESEV
jgi:ABC-type glutathione transport system ATPase component